MLVLVPDTADGMPAVFGTDPARECALVGVRALPKGTSVSPSRSSSAPSSAAAVFCSAPK